MQRIAVLAFGVVLIGGFGFLTAGSSRASETQGLYLVGDVSDVTSDGAFPAVVTLKDPVTGAVKFSGESLFDIHDGAYKARLLETGLPRGDYRVEVEGLEAAEEFSMAGFVNLQDVTPGVAQTGHLNISGYVLAGRIGLGTSPTLARVQVNESGSIQGVRSITNTGTAVYGQATAGTGLAAGGYFTTSSVGGRAMVGDALSTTGSTVGGLFYNRSQAGVAVWGRHVNGAGASIGVFGQTASSSGTAVMAENTGTGDTVSLAGPNSSLLTAGILPKHQYTASTAATMVPIAYGYVGGNGTVISGSENFSVQQIATGAYAIDVSGLGDLLTERYVVTGTPIGLKVLSFFGTSVADFRVSAFDISGAVAVDTDFMFVVYRAASFEPPAPPARWMKSETTDWSKADPKSYQKYVEEFRRRQNRAMEVDSRVIPVDEAEPAGQSGAMIRPRK